VTALDLSADLGLVAVGFATLNLCIGLLISVRYSPVRFWPHRPFDIFWLHRRTGYCTLAVTALHPLPLLLAARPSFRVLDIALPLWSPSQPVENTIGAAALYLLVVVIITSIYHLRLGRRLWKRLHFLTYAVAAGLFIHGLLTNPKLDGSRIDPWDGEKLFVEGCFGLIVIASILRVRYRLRKRAGKRVGATPPASIPVGPLE
jgi:sulfoxide reductase heme-binding subunit YedZ